MKSNKILQLDSSNHVDCNRGTIALCKKAIARLEEAREAVVSQFADSLQENGRLLRLALNEAEALAWQTDYPHLLFPALAVEKAQAVETWQAHQRELRGTYLEPALAA